MFALTWVCHEARKGTAEASSWRDQLLVWDIGVWDLGELVREALFEVSQHSDITNGLRRAAIDDDVCVAEI